MDELSLYERILGLEPPWVVEHVDLSKDGVVHVYVEHDREAETLCVECGYACPRYDTRDKSWRHLDTCQYQTIVHGAVPRTRCPEHGVLQVDVPWAEKNSRFTLLFEAMVIRWLKEASINAVSRRLGLSWNAIDGIMQRAVARGISARKSVDYQHIAVDEISSKKGHRYRKQEMRLVPAAQKRPLHLSRFHWLRSEGTLKRHHKNTINALSKVARKTARAWAIRQYAMQLWHYSSRGWA